jgi:hypothetical protein
MFGSQYRLLVTSFGMLVAIGLAACQRASCQTYQRQMIEVGGIGQTTGNLERGPYQIISGPNSLSMRGIYHEQLFGGLRIGYEWALSRYLAFSSEFGYMFGHQPTVNQTGGNEVLAHAGLSAHLPFKRFRLYTRVQPGISSFSDVARLYNAAGQRQYGRITHFSLNEAIGAEFPLTGRNLLRVDVSRMSIIEGDAHQGYGTGVSLSLPGGVENHLVMGIGLAHSFGRDVSNSGLRDRTSPLLEKNELIFSWVLQPQVHLELRDLNVDHGIGITAAHFFKPWLAVDASYIHLPGGDTPNYQDGGAETEALLGVKVGIHRPHYGIFATVRPGVASFTRTYNDETIYPSHYVRSTDFAIASGAAIEIYPRTRALLRLDIGETETSFPAVEVKLPTGTSSLQPSSTRSSGLFMIGAGFRF